MGTPQGVFHFNTDVELRLILPGTGEPGTDGEALLQDLQQSVLPASLSPALGVASVVASQIDWGESDGCSDQGTAEFDNLGLPCPYYKDRRVTLPLGTHVATWRGDTMFQLIDVVFIHVPGFPNGTKWKKAKEFLVNVLVEVLSIGAGEITKKYALGIQSLRNQTIRVLDTVPPVLSPTLFSLNQSSPYLIEANSPGGEYSRQHVFPIAQSYDIRENCGRSVTRRVPATGFFWPLNTDNDPDKDIRITYEFSDLGPTDASGGVNTVTDEVWIRVVDTRAPEVNSPPDIVMVSATGPVSVDPGIPQVFDVADLEPAIEVSLNGGAFTSTVPTSFPFGQNQLVWRATDSSGNVSDITDVRAMQLVNIKPSNVAPVANARTGANAASAVSFEQTEIVLTGSDGDFDPLSFAIAEQPNKGFFVSPLLPYFVADFRLEAQESVDDMRDGCDQNPPIEPDQDLISNPSFFASDDDGFTYVIDTRWYCGDSQGSNLRNDQRIAKFDPAGEVINFATRPTNVNRLFIDFAGRASFVSSGNGINDHALSIFAEDLSEVEQRFSLNNVASTYAGGAYDPDLCVNPNMSMSPIDEIYASVMDRQGVIYSADRRDRLLAYDSTDTSFGEAAYLGSLTGCNDFFFGRIDDIALDSEDNVYLSDRDNDRIYKFTASYFDADGDFVPGKFVGWMGKCTQDTAPGDEAVCIFDNPNDPNDGHSLGFSCTDEYCGSPRSGSGDGQFNEPRGIDIDDNDVLYVLDRLNQRVQRFTSDGLFAGKAESNCESSRCFAIGDFGTSPRDVNVNSGNFYVLDTDTDILHIFATSVVERIDNTSAKITYQTDDNYQNESDFFTFKATDGLMVDGEFVMSNEARVDINLSRNFRAPQATPFIEGQTDEDNSVPITLDGSDPDAPLDILNFGVATAPANGSVQIVGSTATYTPDANYFGVDQFEFFATDGSSQSDPEAVIVTVLPVNDAPSVDLDSAYDIGRGYEVLVEAAFDDPDPADQHTIVANWGDGTVDPEGEQLEDGTLTGPVLDQSVGGNGYVRAPHTYTSVGNFQMEFCATDQVVLVNDVKQPTAESVVTCEQATARVVEMADLSLVISELDRVTDGNSEFFKLTVGYTEPDVGSGIGATGLRVDLAIGSGASIVVMDADNGSCQVSGASASCTLNTLQPGATTDINVGIAFPSGVSAGAEFDLEGEVTSILPDPNGGRAVGATVTLVDPADFIVTASSADADLPDDNPGDGVCRTSEDTCTLRAAIQEAQSDAAPKVIALGSGTYLLNREGAAKRLKIAGEDQGDEGDLDIRGSMTIRGLGPDRTIVDGFGKDRVFEIFEGEVTIEGMTITGGDVEAEENDAPGPWTRLGGAILMRSTERLTLRDVEITGNAAASFGGGVTTIGPGELRIRRSAIYSNRSRGGGGLFVSGPTSIKNSTVSGNTSAGFGGGIYVDSVASTPSLLLEHVTVAANVSDSEGGGLYVSNAGSIVASIGNSLIASNASGSTGTDCQATLVSLGGNLIGDTKTNRDGVVTCQLTGGVSDQLDQRARIDDLSKAVTGGRAIHELRADSSAVNGAILANCASVDQRGLTRADPAGGTGCDIGAAAFTDLLFGNGFEE